MELKELPNLGTYGVSQLEQAGITTAEELRDVGAEKAWLRIRGFDSGACLHLLYGLEGAVRGIPKKDIPAERKTELKEFFNSEQ